MSIWDTVNKNKYPLLAIFLILIIYGFFIQTNNNLSRITGFATAGAPILGSSSVSSCSATKVSWSRPATNPSGISVKYAVLYSVYSTFPGSVTNTVTTTSTSKVLTGLAPGIKYYWKVLACPSTSTSLADCGISSYKSFTQRCTPKYISFVVTNPRYVNISWQQPTGDYASGFEVSVSSQYDSNYFVPKIYRTKSLSIPVSIRCNTLYSTKVAGYATIGGKDYLDYSSPVQFQIPCCVEGSDGGKNPSVPGTCNSAVNGEFPDYCIGSSVSEAYCYGDSCTRSTIACPTGQTCNAGMCVLRTV